MIETRTVEIVAVPEGSRPARVTVHTRGQGPLAVLVHGFPLDHRMWLDVMHGPLAQNRTLCAVDLRGHGDSPWCGDGVHTMERFADDVAAVIKTLGDGQADLAGLSMGGYVALALMDRHPELVRTLVLSNTRATADNDEQKQGREAAIETVATQGRSAVCDAMLPKLLAPGADALVRAQLRTMIEGTPVESIVADQRGLMQRADRREGLANIKVPTMIVAGEHDALTPVADAEVMRDGILGARLEVVKGTAHMTPMEAPKAWSDAVADVWL